MLARKLRDPVPDTVRNELISANESVYVFAKHHYNLEHHSQDESEPEYYFELDEAIAVYIIVQVLGKALRRTEWKATEKVFLEGWALNDGNEV